MTVEEALKRHLIPYAADEPEPDPEQIQNFATGYQAALKKQKAILELYGLKPSGAAVAAGPIRRAALRAAGARAFGSLSKAGQYGIKPYGVLTRLLNKTGLAAHHLIPQRFAALMGQNVNKMACVAVTPAEHLVFTEAWRAAIPYGPGTQNATTQQVLNAARQIYANYPAILQALGL
jgi:hypothetical protein